MNPLSYLPLCESGEDCVFRGKEKKISLSDSLVVFIHFSPSEPAGLSSLRLIGGWWTSNLWSPLLSWFPLHLHSFHLLSPPHFPPSPSIHFLSFSPCFLLSLLTASLRKKVPRNEMMQEKPRLLQQQTGAQNSGFYILLWSLDVFFFSRFGASK